MTGDLTFGERLALSIKSFGPRPRGRQGADGSIRGFQIELSRYERGLHGKGATRQMVHRYLKKDGPEPPADFIKEAAKILSPVRYEWLATGTGEMTEVEQRVTSSPELTKYVGEQGWSASTQALFFSAWQRFVAGMPDGNVLDYELLHLGLLLVDLVNLPLRHWGFKHELSDRETNDLAVAALHWLMLAMPEAGKGDRFHSLGVIYADGFSRKYVENREDRADALIDEKREEIAARQARLESQNAELEAEIKRKMARGEALQEKLWKEGATGEEVTAAFDELRQELGLTDETTEEDSDV